MSNHPRGNAPQPTDGHRGLRLLALAAVALGVLLLMAAAFVLSYPGIHAVALSAGVSARFARIYPVIFDAMLVIACAAVLALRGAGLPSRCYAWLTMLALLAAAAGADTVHATNTRLPHTPAAAAAAIIPWVLVLIGFGLLLSMLRHARLRRVTLAAAPEKTFAQPAGHVEVRRHGLDDLFGSKSSADAAAVRYLPPAKPGGPADLAPAKPGGPADLAPDLAIESDPGHDDPSSDEAHPAGSHAPGSQEQQPAGSRGNSASAFSPAPTVGLADGAAASTAGGPGRPAGAESVPEARHAPDPMPDATPAAKAAPTALAKSRPRPDPAGDAKPAADAKPARELRLPPETGPVSEEGPATEPEPAAAAEPAAEDGPATEPEPAAAAEPAAEDGPAAVPEPVPEAEAEPVPETAPESNVEIAAERGTIPGPEAETVPTVPPQLERVRSSPVPPEA